MEQTYSANALAGISGISRYQLIRWERAGLLRPARRARGKGLLYTREQALGVIALGELRKRGVCDRRIRAASAALPSVAEHSYLVFDGCTMYTRSSATDLAELVSQTTGPCIVLKMEALLERLGQ